MVHSISRCFAADQHDVHVIVEMFPIIVTRSLALSDNTSYIGAGNMTVKQKRFLLFSLDVDLFYNY
jgi:hypothetical protein